MTEPRTKAGRRLLAEFRTAYAKERGILANKILAIEREAASLDGLTVDQFGDAVMAALRLRLVHGATDALYTPRQVAEMVGNVIVKQLAALREGETRPNQDFIDRAVWNELERQPGFTEGMERGKAELDAGLGRPFVHAAPPPLDGLTVERLHNAIYQVWRKGHRDLRVGLTTPTPWDGTLAAAILADLRDEGETPTHTVETVTGTSTPRLP